MKTNKKWGRPPAKDWAKVRPHLFYTIFSDILQPEVEVYKEFNLEKILAIVKRRMERSMDKVMDIMILNNGKLVGVFRYTPLK